jgi:dipeptidyl aminopeptidase/acylaminoacyl peptidase
MNVRSLVLAVALVLLVSVDANAAGLDGKIAFHSFKSDSEEIFAINADGSGETRLTTNPLLDRQPAFSPDGSRVAFSRDDYYFGCRLWLADADGSNAVALTKFDCIGSPAFSPDASKIVATDTDKAFGGDIVIMDADGSNLTGLTSTVNGYGINDVTPVFSADGRHIVYVRYTDSDVPELWSMNTDGTDQKSIGTRPVSGTDPDVSPDGSKIAFSFHGRVFTMNANGTDVRTLTSPGAGFSDVSPTFSPDGRKVAYARIGANYVSRIYIVNIDGSGNVALIGAGAHARDPDWGPGSIPVAPPPAPPAPIPPPSETVDCPTGTSASVHCRRDGRGRLVMVGTAKGETFVGSGRRDRIFAMAGNDLVVGRGGSDLVFGGPGRDRIFGAGGNDRLYGNSGDDRLSGGKGKDVLKGNSGNDRLTGGPGRDRLDCGAGDDDRALASPLDHVGRNCG